MHATSDPSHVFLCLCFSQNPMFEGKNRTFDVKIQPGVPYETIKGAAIAGAALTFFASKGLIVSSAAGLSAAFVAISQGQSGDAVRAAGKVAWDVSETAANLLEKASENTQFSGLTKGIAEKLILAAQKSREAQLTVETLKETGSGNVTESELESEQASGELERVLKEAENAIDAADEAIKTADETLQVDDDLINVLEQEAAKLEEEARMAEEEARAAEEEEEARVKAEEEALLKAEEEEEARLQAEEADRIKTEEEASLKAEEDARLEEEALAAEEARLAEEERLAKEAEGTEDYDDEWEAAVKLAQQGIEGKIVGIDEAITDDDAKADWDAAGILAQELEQGAGEEFDVDEDEEVDMEALGRAAREAVEKFEQEMREKEAAKKEVRDDWAESMVVDTDVGDDDDDDFDLLPEGDLEEIARAARAAVELAESVDEEKEEEVETAAAPAAKDWSILKVAELKIALKSRGLTPVGKKAELVAMMDASDLEKRLDVAGDFKDDESDLDDEEVDMEELGRQARAAVQMFEAQDKAAIFEAEEPSDEVLMQLENEGLPLFDDVDDEDDSGDASSDNYDSMNVAQLKDELRSRGLRVTGKKAELIQRLQSP